MDTLGKRIAYARKRKGWSQNRLEKAAKLSLGMASRLEHDERAPTPDTLIKVSSALGVRVDWLLTGVAPMEVEEPASARSDRIPNRAEAARLARDDGVSEAAIRSVAGEGPDQLAMTRSVLWWADRMRVRQHELIDQVRARSEAPGSGDKEKM